MIFITTDLHLTDRPEHEYRFEFLYHLYELGGGNRLEPKLLFILGDLTDAKNNHSARLVNRIVTVIEKLAQRFEVIILKGNHDYTDPSEPFFGFLNYLTNVRYIKEPSVVSSPSINLELMLLFLPHTFNPQKEWEELEFSSYDYIFMHQTVSGSVASTGQELEGLPSGYFKIQGFNGRVISGDVHVPQTIGNVTYVGSPYHVHFGDNFTPRYLQLTSESLSVKFGEHFYTKAPKRVSAVINKVSDLDAYNLVEGDHVKVKMRLPREELADWDKYKKQIVDECARRKVRTFGIELSVDQKSRKDYDVRSIKSRLSLQSDPFKVVEDFSRREYVGHYVSAVGRELLDASRGNKTK